MDRFQKIWPAIAPSLTIGVPALLLGVSLALLYRAAKPKPIPGIPYNVASAQNLLGDVSYMKAHIKDSEGTFITYIVQLMQTLNTPIVQVFIRPFSKPLVVMGDFHEAHDILIHRHKDFDRSDSLGDLVKGLAPDHHIHLKTNDAWKRQRRLVQDLMTPSFLHKVASPALHSKVSVLIHLWREKSRAADGKPWPAADDVNHVALDAVTAFAFGEDSDHSATRPALQALRALGPERLSALRRGESSENGQDQPMQFPRGEDDELLRSVLNLTETVGEVQGNPWPALTWAWIMRRPRVKRAVAVKEAYINKALTEAVRRVRDGEKPRSAVDYMVTNETKLADKDGRTPDYFSRVMVDEVRFCPLSLSFP